MIVINYKFNSTTTDDSLAALVDRPTAQTNDLDQLFLSY